MRVGIAGPRSWGYAPRSWIAVAAQGGLDGPNLAATVNRPGEVLGPRFNPLHGPRPESHRQECQEDFFGIEVELGSEASAHLGGHDSDVILGKADCPREHRPHQMGNLRRGVKRELSVAGEVLRDDAARFH